MQAAVNQLIACQLVLSPDPDSTEDLIIDVPIQRLHQFWRRQAVIYPQEHNATLALGVKKDFLPLIFFGFSSINPNSIAIFCR